MHNDKCRRADCYYNHSCTADGRSPAAQEGWANRSSHNLCKHNDKCHRAECYYNHSCTADGRSPAAQEGWADKVRVSNGIRGCRVLGCTFHDDDDPTTHVCRTCGLEDSDHFSSRCPHKNVPPAAPSAGHGKPMTPRKCKDQEKCTKSYCNFYHDSTPDHKSPAASLTPRKCMDQEKCTKWYCKFYHDSTPDHKSPAASQNKVRLTEENLKKAGLNGTEESKRGSGSESSDFTHSHGSSWGRLSSGSSWDSDGSSVSEYDDVNRGSKSSFTSKLTRINSIPDEVKLGVNPENAKECELGENCYIYGCNKKHPDSRLTKCSYPLRNGNLLTFLMKDITAVRVDVVVNAANQKLLGGGGVDGAIHKAAGPKLIRECKKIKPASNGVRCPVGKAKLTKGPFNKKLHADHVIHAVGPRQNANDANGLLSSCYKDSFAIAEQESYVSIAVPAISCGIYGFPSKKAAEISIQEAVNFANGDPQHLKSIVFAFTNPNFFSQWRNEANAQGLVEKQEGNQGWAKYTAGSVGSLIKKFSAHSVNDTASIPEKGPAGLILYRCVPAESSLKFQILAGVKEDEHGEPEICLLSQAPVNLEKISETATRSFYEKTGALISKEKFQKGSVFHKYVKSLQDRFMDKNSHVQIFGNVHKIPQEIRDMTETIDADYDKFLASDNEMSNSDTYTSLDEIKWIQAEKIYSLFADKTAVQKRLKEISESLSPMLLEQLVDKVKKVALAEKTKAEKERVKIERKKGKQERKRNQLPKPTLDGTEVTDIVPLPESDPEYSAVSCHVRGNATCINKVNLPNRKALFHAYVKGLPARHNTTTTPVFHGTPSIDAANSIARSGPDLKRAGTHGSAYGAGFYTDTTPEYPTQSFARDTGAVLVCEVAMGISYLNGGSSTTADTLANQTPACQSVLAGTYHILFHPDSVLVKYIIKYGQDVTSAEQELKQKQFAADLAKWEQHQKNHEAKILKSTNRLKMIDYYGKRCDHFCEKVDRNNAILLDRMQVAEKQQFDHSLPMFARKEEFIDLLNRHQALLLKGGTGIGKTVTVPQWVYDHTFCEQLDGELGKKRVAVLVPRKAIAIGLANYISTVRNVRIGEEVGLGCGDNVAFSNASNLVFMTYGFFKAITSREETYTSWDSVILDEAHERNKDADVILPKMALTCKSRNDFKAVIMSATVDCQQFAETFTKNFLGSGVNLEEVTIPFAEGEEEYKGTKVCPVIVVPGVTFDVKDVFLSTDTSGNWDPEADGALDNLAIEVIKIFRNEGSGNVLVFLPTVRDVNESVRIVKSQMGHDDSTVVLPLYASLDSWEKDAVTDFIDYKKYPENEDKRLICFSTNVAEAGITIPGVTAVVETGREISVEYDLALKANRMSKIWISKASRTQRRGRAGRTAPGTCYCMYSEEDMETKMPDYSKPAVTKTNLDGFYLSLVASGIEPESLELLNKEELGDRLTAAKESLEKLGAIAPVIRDGGVRFKITEEGKALNSLPIDMVLAKCIVAGAKEGCTEEMCRIAALMTACSRNLIGSIFTLSPHNNADKDKLNRLKTEMSLNNTLGDHMTLLGIYNAWLDQAKSKHWCNENCINYNVLTSAHGLLKKVHKSLSRCGIPFTDNSETSDKKEGILKALAIGMIGNVAVATDPTKAKSDFELVDGADTMPTMVRIHPSSAVSQSTDVIPNIIFQTRAVSKNGNKFVQGVTAISDNLLLMAKQETVGDHTFDQFRSVLNNMKRCQGKVKTGLIHKKEYQAIAANIKDTRKEFPRAVIKAKYSKTKSSNGKKLPCEVVYACLQSEEENIKAAIKEAIGAGSNGEDTIDVGTGPDCINKFIQSGKQKRKTKILENINIQLKNRYGTVQITGDRATGKLTIKSKNIFLPLAKDYLKRKITQILSGQEEDEESDRKDGNDSQNAQQEENERKKLLCNAHTPQHAIQSAARNHNAPEVFEAFVTMANIISFETPCFYYGGFIRDFVYRGETFDDMDLDVGLPYDYSIGSVNDAFDFIRPLAESKGFKVNRVNPRGGRVLEVIFGYKQIVFPVEIVDALYFKNIDPRVDFNINNLRMHTVAQKTRAQIMVKNDAQEGAGTLAEMERDCRRKYFRCLKPKNEITGRIAKMLNRGWSMYDIPKKKVTS
jgi:HrpA-like RNA helicase/O-acetyl-ADP-ribose deacetylase (regulator of RNase III)